MNTHSSRNWLKLCAMAAFLALTSGVAVGVTNVAMVAQFALSGVKQADQSTAVAVKITNKDIFNLLNATGRFNFRSDAQLILLSFNGQLPTFAVREQNGSNVTTTDISAYFFITEPLEVHAANHLHGYAIYIFNFDNQNGVNFTASGMTTLSAGTITGPGIGPLTRDKTLTSTVSGFGTYNGANMVLRGTVLGGSAKAEID